MEIKPDYPDYDAWMAVRRFNSDLKRRIEEGFVARGVPTCSDLKQRVAARARRSGTDAGVRRKILVVDDERDLADTVEALLAAQGYEVHQAMDGRRGLAAAARLRPDLILLDYELPELDGLEVIAALRASPETRDIPVLLCTASRIGVEEIRLADGFLAKPYTEDLLYEMVHRVMSQTRADGGEKAEKR
jgi:CheY-like chemotaxis protein